MAHKLVWRASDRVLTLTLTGEISLADFSNIGDDIDVMLGEVTDPLVLVVDAKDVRLGRSGLSQARTTSPTYMENRLVEHLLVVTSDKIIRLTLLVVFNLNRSVLRFFDHMDQAEYHLRTVVRQSLR
jgi:hypothetical protein